MAWEIIIIGVFALLVIGRIAWEKRASQPTRLKSRSEEADWHAAIK